MKKIIRLISMVCLLAMLVGMLPVLGVSAADSATITLTPSVEKVKASKEFTIKVGLASNPGICNLTFKLYYDVNAFEYVKSETLNFYMFPSCSATVPAGTTGYVKSIANTGTTPVDTTLTGDFMEFTFRAKADAVLADYEFRTEYDAENTLTMANVKVPTIDASTNVKVVENKAVSTIDSAQVNLGTDISMIYKVTLDPEHAGATMKFTFHGKEYDVEGKATATANVYTYTLAEIAPQCMGDNIKAELIYGGNVVATKDEYSILAYCENTIKKDAATLEMSDEKYAAMKTLIADMLVYGAKAQLYQNYKTNALVDANVTGATTLSGTAPASALREVVKIEGATVVSAGVHFDTTNSLYFKIKVPDNYRFEVRLNEVKLAGTEDGEYDPATSTYYVNIGDISILDYGKNNTYKLYVEAYDYDFEEYTNVYEYYYGLRYNVNTYINRKWGGNEPTAMNNLARALYNYSQSAVKFQEAE